MIIISSYVSREQLDRAKQVDLLTYLQQCEPQELVKLSPNMYSTRTHDSLKISNGLWHQWSSGIGGRSALDYLIKIRGMSLPDAVLRINSGTVSRPSFSYNRKSARKPIMRQGFILPERNIDNEIVVAYLTQRGIDRSIVLDLIAQGRIYEEKAHHNAVFVGIDRDGIPRHAAMRATGSKRFMIDVSGSDKRYSFSLEGSSDSRQLHVFESAIDLLSFCTLEKMSGNDWRQNHMLSLSGVSNDERSGVPEPLRKYLEDQPMVTEVHLHLDNDRAGRIATKAISIELSDKYRCFDSPPLYGKDYNDFLKQKLSMKNRSDAR